MVVAIVVVLVFVVIMVVMIVAITGCHEKSDGGNGDGNGEEFEEGFHRNVDWIFGGG